MYKMCLGRILKKNLENSQPTQLLRYLQHLSPIKLITKYYNLVFCIQFNVAMETVNPKRGSCMVWEINMGVCPRLDFKNIMLFNCLGCNFNIYGAFGFLCNSIAILRRHE